MSRLGVDDRTGVAGVSGDQGSLDALYRLNNGGAMRELHCEKVVRAGRGRRLGCRRGRRTIRKTCAEHRNQDLAE